MRYLVAIGIAAVMLVATIAPASADSIMFFGQNSGWYLYLGTATDSSWTIGDQVTLTGMDYVSDVLSPSSFSVTFDRFSATWTCIQATSGIQFFGVASSEAAGTIPWSITSNNSGSGNVTGPEYVPEPATMALFSGGLLAVGIALRRRREASRA